MGRKPQFGAVGSVVYCIQVPKRPLTRTFGAESVELISKLVVQTLAASSMIEAVTEAAGAP